MFKRTINEENMPVEPSISSDELSALIEQSILSYLLILGALVTVL